MHPRHVSSPLNTVLKGAGGGGMPRGPAGWGQDRWAGPVGQAGGVRQGGRQVGQDRWGRTGWQDRWGRLVGADRWADRWGRTGGAGWWGRQVGRTGGRSVEGVHLSAAQQVPGWFLPRAPEWTRLGRCSRVSRALGAPHLSACLSDPRLLSPAAAGPARQLPGNLCPTKTLAEARPGRRPGLIRLRGVLSAALRARPA